MNGGATDVCLVITFEVFILWKIVYFFSLTYLGHDSIMTLQSLIVFLSQIFPKHSWKWFYFFNSLDQWLWEYAIGTKKAVTRKCYFMCSSRASYPRKAMYISQKLTYPQKADRRGFSDSQLVCQTLKRKKMYANTLSDDQSKIQAKYHWYSRSWKPRSSCNIHTVCC